MKNILLEEATLSVVRILPAKRFMSNPPTAHESSPGVRPAPATPAAQGHPGSFIALLRGSSIPIAIAVLAALFIVLTVIVVRDFPRPIPWDVSITHELQEFPTATVGVFLEAVSWPGFAPWNWVIAGVLVLFMLLRRWFAEAAFMALAAAGGLTAEVIKMFIDRPRPSPDLVRVTAELHSYSFPSGHVTGYVTTFGFLFYLVYTLLPHKVPLRWLLLTVLAIGIILVGPSRVYMGQHWASDALAGYALGFTYLLIVIGIYRWWLKRHPKVPVTDRSAPAEPR